MKSFRLLFAAILFSFLTLSTAFSDTIYVDADASGADDGTSWTNAYDDLEEALNAAGAGDEIWVAAGTYYPSKKWDARYGNTSASDRKESFRIPSGVKVYGGFAGTETSVGQRTSFSRNGTNETILSGNIGYSFRNTDNAYHVAFFYQANSNTRLDGFTIKDGYANGESYDERGAGLFVNENSSPTITNCYVTSNYSYSMGGGIFIYDSNPDISYCAIVGNSSGGNGGGLTNSGGSPNISYCTVRSNNASSGGGVYFPGGSPTISNSNIYSNTSSSSGGGILIYNGTPTIESCNIRGNSAGLYGGGVSRLYFGTPTLTNCVISGNYSVNGGGYSVYGSGGGSLTNCTISGNGAIYGGGIGCFSGAGPTIKNGIVWFNSASNSGDNVYLSGSSLSSSFCDIQGCGGSSSWNSGFGTDGGDNIDSHPVFVTPLNPSSAPSTGGDFRLMESSACIDAATSSGAPAEDIQGNSRGANPDIGAYEGVVERTKFYVDDDATGYNVGTNWTDAYHDLQDALDLADSGDEIWVAAGTYYPSQGWNVEYGTTSSDSREESFRIPSGVKVYGGFAGTESTVGERANYGVGKANETILSGDLNQDDDSGGDNSENAYHVVYTYRANSNTELNGFTITAGNADDSGLNSDGGGICNYLNSSPAITNCTISGNYVTNDGGGIYNFSVCSPSMTNCLISGNEAGDNGGGIYNENNSSPTISNCTVSGNYANALGGGITSSDNSSPTITNCIIWNNDAVSFPNFKNAGSSYPSCSYCDIQGSGGSDSWDADFGIDDGNNIDQNPLFVNSLDPADAPSTDGDFRILNWSPCVDAGTSTGAPTDDIEGNARIGNPDIGAYESGVSRGTIYVDADASGANDGSSWTDAVTSLNTGIGLAGSGDEVRVAAGTYYPSQKWNVNDGTLSSGSREESFRIPSGVEVFGGFAGTESTIGERVDYGAGETNETILSGDLNQDDDSGGDNSENAYHVVFLFNAGSNSVFDGFTISSGHADGTAPNNSGGGIYLTNSDPSLTDCRVINNNADNGGGLYCNNGSSPNLSSCVVSENTANFHGGGIYDNGSCSPTLTKCRIQGNSANFDGGGVYNYSSCSPILINCLITGNKSNYDGGAMYNYDASSPEIINCTISSNSALNGGGIYNNLSSSPVIANSIIWNNSASNTGENIINVSSSPTYSFCDIQASGGSSSWDANFGTDNGNNIDSNPFFITAVDPADAPTTGGDFRLYANSPCIDAGDNSANSETYDIAGNARIQNGTIDMGAYEGGASVPTQATSIAVSNIATNSADLSWTRGTGDRCALFLKTDGSGEAAPEYDTDYAENSDFSSAEEIGSTGWFCLADQTGASVSVVGLAPETLYRAHVCEYFNTGGTEMYIDVAATDNPINFRTRSQEPSAHALVFRASPGANGGIFFNFTAANQITNCDGYLLLMRECEEPTDLPNDGIGYSVGDVIGNSIVAAIITNTSQTNMELTSGITSGTTYQFKLIPFNWDGENADTYNYRTSPAIPKAVGNSESEISAKVDNVTVPDGITRRFSYDFFIEVASEDPVEVESGGTLVLSAGTSVKFLPGFKAEGGSSVTTEITGELPCSVDRSGEREALTGLPTEPLSMNIYPNPNQGLFTIDLSYEPEEPVTIEISNLLGAKQAYRDLLGASFRFDISDFPQGVYFVTVRSGADVLVGRVVYR